MKRLFRFAFAMTALIAAAGIMTSCDDEGISYTLEGTWEGDMYQEYCWEGTTYEPSYTEVCFLKDPCTCTSGNGYWVDYFNSWVPWKNTYIANHMTWTVSAGCLYLYLVEDDIEFTIRDYRLNDEFFRGELLGSDGSYGRFSLRHVSSPNWNSYYWGDSYYTKSGDAALVMPKRITN